jgi:hypothetical protein
MSWSQPTAPVPVGDLAREIRRDRHFSLAAVDDHEIIAETVHLVKVDYHRSAAHLGGYRDQVHQRGRKQQCRDQPMK